MRLILNNNTKMNLSFFKVLSYLLLENILNLCWYQDNAVKLGEKICTEGLERCLNPRLPQDVLSTNAMD